MTEENRKEQLDRDMEQFLKDLKELDKKIDMIGKIDYVCKGIPPDILNDLLIKDGLIRLSSPLKNNYDVV